jgi:iron complex outermembrane receptor protein
VNLKKHRLLNLYTGKQLLSNGTETTDFTTLGLLLMQKFKVCSVFVNFENFTDRRVDFHTAITASMKTQYFQNYTPLLTDLYLGIIIKPFGNEEHKE